MIETHFESIRKHIAEAEWLCSRVGIESEVDAENQIGIISGKLVFRDESIFHFKEVRTNQKRRYRFHYMDKEEGLICRWDNAPHYPKLRNFPHHLHLPKEVKECEEMVFSKALSVIKNIVIKNLENV